MSEDFDYDLDYEESDFKYEFPEISSDLLFDMEFPTKLPTKLRLHVNVYIDPYFGKTHETKEFAEEAARQTMAQAAKILQDKTLSPQIELVYNKTIYWNLSKAHVEPKNINDDKLLSELRGPYRVGKDYHVAHVYLTASNGSNGRPKLIGKAKKDSICTKNETAPRLIVHWLNSAARTGLTVAHELGHVLGMSHDFRPVHDTSTGETILVRDTCVGYLEKDTGEFIMNYGNQRKIWSTCSNEDFARYYKAVVKHNTQFCLEDISPGNNTMGWWLGRL